MITYDNFLDSRGIPNEFPKDVQNQVAVMPAEVSKEEFARRTDFRMLKIVTIDGDDAKDLDDAIHIKQLDNGNFELGVHIADVSHYVKENSPLDKEAMDRGTSTYLINKVVPMLPKELSNGICSLNPQVDRLTLSCVMEIDHSGGVVDYDICESVIKTAERMTYNNVQKILDGDPKMHKNYQSLVDDFSLMKKLAKILEGKRIKRGSLMFEVPEPYIVLDENDFPTSIGKYEIHTSNKIIEEFMLVANETVARHMCEKQLPLVYRVHENPSEEKITRFAEMLKFLGLKLPKKTDGMIKPKDLQTIIEQIKGKDCEHAVNTIMLRSLMKARYCEENLGHFGLAAKYYCHFTSPIRRYPDLIVHRIVKEMLQGKLDDKRKRHFEIFVEEASDTSSQAEIKSMNAERDWDDYKICQYMEDKIGEEFVGFISSVAAFGIFVQLDNLAEGLIKMGDLKDDYYIFDDVHYKLRGKRTGAEFSIGDTIKVKLVRVNPELSQIDFIPIVDKTDKEKDGAKKFKNKKRRSK